MSGLNKLAILREFPFLNELCDAARLGTIQVQRFDEKVLSLGGYDIKALHKIYLLNKDGDLIVQVGEQIPSQFFKLWAWSYKADRYDTVGATFSRLFQHRESLALRVTYVVDICGAALVLYKPPTRFDSIGGWLVSQVSAQETET